MNVLLLAPTDAAQGVAERLRTWSSALLLQPYCIWIASDPEDTDVCRVTNGNSEKLTLAESLKHEDVNDTRVLACLTVARGEQVDGTFSEAVEAFLTVAREQVLDFPTTAPLNCALAVMPHTAREHVPAEVFRPDWTSLLVAPEDRERPGVANQLADPEPDRFVAHVAHAAATIAALWSTPKANRPDLIGRLGTEPAGALPVGVRVVRCFSRLVDLGYVADHVAAVAFAAGDGWPRPSDRFERPRDPEPVIEHLARSFLGKHSQTLKPQPFVPIEEDPPRQLTLMEALREFYERLVAYVQKRPLELLDDARAAVYNKAVDYIQRLAGSDSDIRILRWGQLPEGKRSLTSLTVYVEDEGQLAVEDGSFSATWRDLRLLVLGIVDGSALPDGLGAAALKRGGRRYVVCDPSLLAHDPALAKEPVANDGDGPVEPQHTHEQLGPPLLERIHTEVRAAVGRAQAIVDTLSTQAERETARPSQSGPANHRPPWWRRILSRRRPATQRGRFEALLRRMALSAAAAFITIVAAWALLAPLRAAAASALVVLLWVARTAKALPGALMRPRLSDDARDREDLRRLNFTLALAQARGDLVRLQRRLDELEDWTAILAELVHRPWFGESLGNLQLHSDLSPESLPAALAVRVAPADRERIERIGARARTRAFHQGWLSAIYRRVERLARERYAMGMNIDPESLLDAAADPTEGLEQFRGALLDTVLSGAGRKLRENPLSSQLLQAIDDTQLDELAPMVTGRGRGEPAEPLMTWLTRPDGVEEVARTHGHRVTALGSSDGVGVALLPKLWLTSAGVARGLPASEGLEIWLSADTHLALVELGEGIGEGEGYGELPIAEPQHVMPIVTFVCRRGTISARWGFVTRAGSFLTVACEGGRPSPGAPLFDLDGRLVAVHGVEGTAYRVADAQTLRDQATELSQAATNGSAQVPVGDLEGDLAAPSASAFLTAITQQSDPVAAFLPSYWTGLTEANAVDPSLSGAPPAATAEAGSIGYLSGGARFMSSLRVMVHSVQATSPVAPHELAACAAKDVSHP